MKNIKPVLLVSNDIGLTLLNTIERILGSGKLAWYCLLALLVSVIAVTKTGLHILPNWQNIGGVEAHWVAQSLAAGKGGH